MRTAPALVLAVALAACGPRATNTPVPLLERVGIYKFEERVPELPQPIQGRVIVTRDSVILDVEGGGCRYAEGVNRADSPITYQCGYNDWFYFDRANPVEKSTFKTKATVSAHVPSCVRFTLDKAGNQVCQQMGSETVEREVFPAGRLHLTPIAKP